MSISQAVLKQLWQSFVGLIHIGKFGVSAGRGYFNSVEQCIAERPLGVSTVGGLLGGDGCAAPPAALVDRRRRGDQGGARVR